MRMRHRAIELQVLPQREHAECFCEPAIAVLERTRSVRAQAERGVQIVRIGQLTVVLLQCPAFQIQRGIDPHEAVREQRSPDLVAEATELEVGTLYGLGEQRACSLVIRMLLEKERQIDELRPDAQKQLAQPRARAGIGAQAPVFRIQEFDFLDSENSQRPLRFALAYDAHRQALRPICRTRRAALAAICQEYYG